MLKYHVLNSPVSLGLISAFPQQLCKTTFRKDLTGQQEHKGVIQDILQVCIHLWGFPQWFSGKESTCNAGGSGLILGLGRFPGGGMATQSSILTQKSHGQRSLVGYSLQGHKESDTTEATQHTRAHRTSGACVWWEMRLEEAGTSQEFEKNKTCRISIRIRISNLQNDISTQFYQSLAISLPYISEHS